MKTILFNPFSIYSEKKLLAIGTLATLLGSLAAYYFNVRYDGILDLHIVPVISNKTVLFDNIINIASLVITLFVAGKIINTKTRLIDILTTAIFSRFPFYILPFFNINNTISTISNKMINIKDPFQASQITITEWLLTGTFGIIALVFLVWIFVLMFNGFKTATNAKGTKSTLLFITAIFFAELISKIIISVI